jgi:hypothetical protein
MSKTSVPTACSTAAARPHDRRSGPSVFSSAFLTKYAAKFDGKLRPRDHQPCSRLRLCLYLCLCHNLCLDLCLNLNLHPNPPLFRTLFEWLFRQSFASRFGTLSVLKNPPLRASMFPALCRPRLPARRPVGRPLPCKIVVGLWPATTYGWRSAHGTAGARLPLSRGDGGRNQVLQSVSCRTREGEARVPPRVEAVGLESRGLMPP